MDTLLTYCQHDPQLPPRTRVINICPGCDKRFANDYPGVSTISLWEVLADYIDIPLPDHTGRRMTILDACATRENDKVQEQMIKRASEMPEEDVVVYCISCVKSVHIGGKRPQYLVDLLFGEMTEPGITDPDAWHGMLKEYIEKH